MIFVRWALLASIILRNSPTWNILRKVMPFLREVLQIPWQHFNGDHPKNIVVKICFQRGQGRGMGVEGKVPPCTEPLLNCYLDFLSMHDLSIKIGFWAQLTSLFTHEDWGWQIWFFFYEKSEMGKFRFCGKLIILRSWLSPEFHTQGRPNQTHLRVRAGSQATEKQKSDVCSMIQNCKSHLTKRNF